jgi:hypothetical protein
VVYDSIDIKKGNLFGYPPRKLLSKYHHNQINFVHIKNRVPLNQELSIDQQKYFSTRCNRYHVRVNSHTKLHLDIPIWE